MGVSKHRKDHTKKAKAFSDKIKTDRKKKMKQYIDSLNQLYMDQINKVQEKAAQENTDNI